jgi:hypothetical protein
MTMGPRWFLTSPRTLLLAWLATALAVSPLGICANCEQPFQRGDVDAEGSLNITDGLRILDFLFLCGPISAHSNLPGVRIEFPEQPCRFSLSEVAAGIELVYHVVVDQDIPGVKSAQSSAEQCGAPLPPSGLSVVREVIRGGDQEYCICDAGLCHGREPTEQDLRPGVFTVVFPWDGRNWQGPSDTFNQPGPPFPPGRYIFEAYARGTFRTATEPWSCSAWAPRTRRSPTPAHRPPWIAPGR